jgi:hypothetical protein
VSSVTSSVSFLHLHLCKSGGKRLNMMDKSIKLSNQSVCRNQMGVNTGLIDGSANIFIDLIGC